MKLDAHATLKEATYNPKYVCYTGDKTFLVSYLESHVFWIVFSFLLCPVWKETFSGPIDLLRPPTTVRQAEPSLDGLTAELWAKFDSWS